MNLTKLFVMTLAVALAATNTAFAGQSPIKSEPQQKAEAHKPSEKQTVPAKSNRSRTAYDPVLAAEQAKASKPYRKSMETVNQLLTKAESCYKSDKLGEAERLARETIASSTALSRLFLSDVPSGATSEFLGQARSPQRDARRLIGKIRMKQRFYNEALEWFRADWREGEDKRLDLDIALCYVRSGNDEKARKFATDEVLTVYLNEENLAQLPGTKTSRTLEATLLFVRGMNASSRLDYKEAFINLKEASRMLPENGVFAYFTGEALTDLSRHSDAIPYYRTAIRWLDSKSRLLESAKEREQGAVYAKSIGQ